MLQDGPNAGLIVVLVLLVISLFAAVYHFVKKRKKYRFIVNRFWQFFIVVFGISGWNRSGKASKTKVMNLMGRWVCCVAFETKSFT
jgi:hypothetical protein